MYEVIITQTKLYLQHMFAEFVFHILNIYTVLNQWRIHIRGMTEYRSFCAPISEALSSQKLTCHIRSSRILNELIDVTLTQHYGRLTCKAFIFLLRKMMGYSNNLYNLKYNVWKYFVKWAVHKFLNLRSIISFIYFSMKFLFYSFNLSVFVCFV